jgi:hypothetical protein
LTILPAGHTKTLTCIHLSLSDPLAQRLWRSDAEPRHDRVFSAGANTAAGPAPSSRRHCLRPATSVRQRSASACICASEVKQHGVTSGEFDAFMEDLVATLQAFNVGKAEQHELLDNLRPMRAAIVEVDSPRVRTRLPPALTPAPPL